MSNVNTNTMEQTTELYLKKVLAGNSETVRNQLIDAMETLGYDIIEDEPNIIGRRPSKGWATWFGSANALDYATTLTIRLKSVGANSTRATFDYLIKHGMLNKGDQNLVRQEAKTIAAISKTHAIEKMCSVCETESTDDSKFCRKCGAPLTAEQSELEVLRVLAETRAAKSSIVYASIMTPLAAIASFVLFLIYTFGSMKPKAIVFFLIVCGLGLLTGFIASFFAWNRMKRALTTTDTGEQHLPKRFPEARGKSSLKELPSRNTGEFPELPPQRVPASVTEGTTNLLDNEWANDRKKEKVPLSKKRITNNLD